MAYIGEMQYLTIGNNTYSLPTGGEGSITTEVDPIFSSSPAAGITAADITNWNGKSSTDEKVKAIALPTTSSTYYLVLGSNSGTAETKNYSNKLAFEYSSSQVVLKVGDTTSNQKGRIYLYGPSAGGVTYLDTAATISCTITLPDKSGTVALTSDIPTYTDTNTWRPIQLNGTQILAGTTGTNALNLKAGTNVSLSNSSGTVTINGPDLSGYAQSSAVPTKTSDLTNDGDGTSSFATLADIGSFGGGTVTSVGATNATNGGLSISGSPVTTSGTITIGHSNVLSSAQTTQAVYPIKIDKNGHISAYGSAVTIPTATNSATTGITATTTATKTTLGTASSVYGVKSGTNSTTTASKASGGNGSASTWTFEEKTIPNVTAAGSGSFTSTVTNHVLSFSHTHTAPTIGTAITVQSKSGGGNGTAPTWSFTDVTVPIRADSATSVPNVSVASATVSISDPGHVHSI